MPWKDGRTMAKQTDILTPLQRSFLKKIFSDEWFRRYFYLTGGTALAGFHLYHRYSEDLDFFCHLSDLAPIPALIENVSKELDVPFERTHTSPGFMRFLVGVEVKIDVVADVGYRFGVPELRDNFMVDNIQNIAINKTCAILGRFDAKDYVDLFLILQKEKFDIFELLKLAQMKDGGMEPFVWASLIADVGQLTLLPRMIHPVKLEEIKFFFLKLRDEILDKINPSTLRPEGRYAQG